MTKTTIRTPRRLVLAALLTVATPLAACSDAAPGEAATADPDPARQTAAETRAAPAEDFEGTLQQVVVSLGPEAIRSLVGTSDPGAVLDFSPDRVLEAVQAGEVRAQRIQRSTIEISGPVARLQTEGDPSYTLIDGREAKTHVVTPEERQIMTMDPAVLRQAAAARGKTDAGPQRDAERLGKRSIRGFDTTGYRFDFIGDRVAAVWLSEELTGAMGPIFDVWLDSNPFLGTLDLPPGSPVRVVVVDRKQLASGRGLLPAYTITEFYDLEPGAVDDERLALPAGYKETSFAEMMSGAMR